MEIIRLTAENIDTYVEDCLQLQQELVHEGTPISASQFKATAENPQTYFIGLVETGHVVGMGVVSKIIDPVRTCGYVNNIVVGSSHRGKGYFSVVMEVLETKAKEWGCTDMALTCSRAPVQLLYEKRGYIKKDTHFYTRSLE